MALRFLLVFGITFLGASIHAQDTLMVVKGTVLAFSTREPVADALVATFDLNDPSHRKVIRSSNTGNYQVNLFEERIYRIMITAEGFYPKMVEIALPGPTPEEWLGGFGMELVTVLLPVMDGLDLWGDGEPIGKARYVPESGRIEWDLAYTDAYKARYAEAMELYNARLELKGR